MVRKKVFGWILVPVLFAAMMYGLGRLSWYLCNAQAPRLPAHNQMPKKPVNLFSHAIVRQQLPPADSFRNPQAQPASLRAVFQKIAVHLQGYRKGLAGGISRLELLVHNNSAYLIDRIEVEVSYLNRQGQLVETQVLPLQMLKPMAKTVLKAPDSRRSNEVRFRLLNIYLPNKSPRPSTA